MDGREAGGTPTLRLRAEGAPGTRRTIEARVRDRDGLEAAPVRWKVEITPKLPTAASSFEWGSGFHVNPVPPEDAARFLRDAPE